MATFAQDLRFALRLLRAHPGFALVAILTLALGIGATTSIFSVVDAVLLRPLPYPASDELVHLEIRGGDGNSYPLPDTDFLAWRDRSSAFRGVAVYDTGQGLTLTGEGEPERLVTIAVTDRFFDVLGVRPLLGRAFADGDDRPAAPKRVVLSYAFWQRRFHGDPAVVDRSILLDGVAHAVVGVMPASFAFPFADLDVWRILTVGPPPRRGPFYTWGLARLGPGVTIEQARASLGPVEASIKERYAGPKLWRYTLVPLRDQIVGDVRRVLYLLFGAVGFLLLIATANVASLMLARAAARTREIAVRGALGAGRARVARQLVTESCVLGLLAGVVGLFLATWGTRALVALAPESIPRLAEIHMSAAVFAFALAVSTIAGVLFGLVPALRASRLPLVDSLKEGGRGAFGGRRRAQRAIVIAEITLALMLAIGAGLMIRSVAALGRVNPGFTPARLLTFGVNLPPARYDTPQKVAAFYDALHDKLRSRVAIESVGYSVSLPPAWNAMTDNFMVEGQVLPPNQAAPVAPLLFVDDDYFRTLGVPLVAGRFFDEHDQIDAPPVVIINETLAKRYFANGAAVGKRLKDGGPERPNNPWMPIVGVVGDVTYSGLAAPPEPAFYLSYRQNPHTRRYVVLRTAADPHTVLAEVRAAIASLDADLPVSRVWTIEELMAMSVASPRFRTTLVSAFAIVGLLLAAIGIYGVVASSVSERTRELGVRVALGATRADVIRLVLAETLTLAATGVVAGVAGALVITRLMASLLFGVTPTDVTTFAVITGVLLVTALVAGYVPARRATHVDPMIALRAE